MQGCAVDSARAVCGRVGGRSLIGAGPSIRGSRPADCRFRPGWVGVAALDRHLGVGDPWARAHGDKQAPARFRDPPKNEIDPRRDTLSW